MGFVMGAGAWLLFAAIVGLAAGRRDRSTATYFMLALLLTPVVAGIWLWAAGRGGSVCPRCRGHVEPGAIACRFCGSAFATSSADLGPSAPLLIGIVFATVALTILHATAFDMNVRFLVPLMVVALAIGAGVRLTPSLKLKSSRELVAWIRQRPMIWKAGIGVVALCEFLTVGDATLRYVHHRRVTAALGSSNDCDCTSAWGALSPEDRATASAEELTTIGRREAGCAERKRQETADRYVQQCGAVAKHLLAGELSAADRVVLAQPPPVSGEYLSDPTAALANRIATRTLVPTDLALGWLPCGPVTRPAYLTAVASSSVTLWSIIGDATVVPEDVLREIGAAPVDKGVAGTPPTAPLTEQSKAALHAHAEDAASKISSPTTSVQCASALGLCRLDERFGNATGLACANLAKQALSFRKTEDAKARAEAIRAKAKADAEEARAKAKAARCDAQTGVWQACNRNCDNLMLNGGDNDAVFRCEGRCDSAHGRGECE